MMVSNLLDLGDIEFVALSVNKNSVRLVIYWLAIVCNQTEIISTSLRTDLWSGALVLTRPILIGSAFYSYK